jgi:hypothetical protein
MRRHATWLAPTTWLVPHSPIPMCISNISHAPQSYSYRLRCCRLWDVQPTGAYKNRRCRWLCLVFHLASHMICCAGCSISVVLWRGISTKPEKQFETKFIDFCQKTAKSIRKRLPRSRTSQRKTISSSASIKRSPPAALWRLIEERPLPESILVYVRLGPKKCRLVAFLLT